MTVGWIDGTAGASGDMLLGALVDVGVPLEAVRSPLNALGLGIGLRAEPVVRAGLGATRIHVDVDESDSVRRLDDIIELLDLLDSRVREPAASTFRRLAEAEAGVHRTSIDEVHFHEVGALDSIADVVGVCAGFVHLGLTELHCSTLSLGSGTTRGAHGPIPVPAPAVLAVLRDVGLVAAGPAPYESTTPTGAALLAEWVSRWGPMPTMAVGATGSGAGTRDSDVVANVCRLVTGDATTRERTDVLVQIDANVDDLDPRMWPEAIDAVMQAGALDAWVTPIVMKKGRPAHTFSALCDESIVDAACTAIFDSTSTIGVRRHVVDREVLDRVMSEIVIAGSPIRVKTASRSGVVVNRSLEWDDVIDAARRSGTRPKDVVADAMAQLSDGDRGS